MSAFFKPLFPGLAALTLAACNARDVALNGEWEGTAGEGKLALDFHPDGTAVMQIEGGGHNADYYCTWSVAADKVHLVHASGQMVEFRIVSISEDTLELRVGGGSAETCKLYRTGSPQSAPSP